MKTLLVPLLGIASDARTILNAVELARILDAHVTVMFAGGHLSELISDVEPHYGVLKPRLQIEARAVLARQLETARHDFDALVREHQLTIAEMPTGSGGTTIQFESRRGTAESAVREAAIYHDAVVFGCITDDASGSYAASILKSALDNCGRPVLSLPEHLPEPFGSHVAIAWNGSVQGAHAVAAALPWLRRANAIHIVTVATAKTAAAKADELQRFLGWHGIQASIRKRDTGTVAVGATILETVQDVEADFLVLGAYTHSRVREMILGGVTQFTVANAKLPVLFAR